LGLSEADEMLEAAIERIVSPLSGGRCLDFRQTYQAED
jgi:hypothetical protein